MFTLIRIIDGVVFQYIIARNYSHLMQQLKGTENPDAICFIDARNPKPEIHPDIPQGFTCFKMALFF